METLEYIGIIFGGGMLFAFLPIMYYLTNSDPANIEGALIFTLAMIVIGIGLAAYHFK